MRIAGKNRQQIDLLCVKITLAESLNLLQNSNGTNDARGDMDSRSARLQPHALPAT